MTVAEVVGRLAADGATLRVEGDQLRYQGPARLLTEHLRAFVASRRSEIVAFLRRPEGDLTDGELDALAFRRREPGARILDAFVAGARQTRKELASC